MSETSTLVPEWQKPVLRIPMNQAFPELGEVREFKNKIGLFNPDRTRCYDVVSPRYQIVEHGASVARIYDALERYFGPGKLPQPQVRTYNGGARMRGYIGLPLKKLVVAKRDVSEIRVDVRNSYDRSCVFRASLGALRLICTNGMTTLESFGAVRMKHINVVQDDPDARARADQELMHEIDQMVNQAPRLEETWRKWAEETVTLAQAKLAIAPHFPEMYTAPILDDARWQVERTMWSLYNDMTHMSSHLTKSVQRRQTFDDMIARIFYDGPSNSAEEGAEILDDDDES